MTLMNPARKLLLLIALLVCAAGVLAGCGPARREERKVTREMERAARKAEAQSGEIVWRVKTNRKVVALTLDDGPDPKYTPFVLDLARRERIKLTFFLIGREIEAHPDLARQEVAQGHQIGNHTWDHPEMTLEGERQDIAEIERCEDAIERISGRRTRLFRPPGGDYASPGDTAIRRRVLRRVGNGGIILAHTGHLKQPPARPAPPRLRPLRRLRIVRAIRPSQGQLRVLR